MNTKHTPGPWQYAFEGGTVAFITETDGTTVCKLSVTENSTAHSALAANARLIASAPDLLAALKSMLSMPDYDGSISTSTLRRSIKHAAKAAIAKATT